MKNNYPLFNSVKYFKKLSNSIDNLQKMHGITFEVYRVKNRKDNKFVKAFGPSMTNLKSTEFTDKVCEVNILASPQEIYTVYCIGSGNGEIIFTLTNNQLLVGDILRYTWIDGQVLEFTIIELPRTLGDSYAYKMKSTYQTGKDINSKEDIESKKNNEIPENVIPDFYPEDAIVESDSGKLFIDSEDDLLCKQSDDVSEDDSIELLEGEVISLDKYDRLK